MAGSEKLKVDYSDLSELDNKLTRIVNSMGADGGATQALANAVGDPRLSQRVIEFGNSWAVHRTQIKEDLEWMRDKVRQIAVEFEKVDTDFASGLKG